MGTRECGERRRSLSMSGTWPRVWPDAVAFRVSRVSATAIAPLVASANTATIPRTRIHMSNQFRGARIIFAMLATTTLAALAACGSGDSVTGPVDQTPVAAATVQATPAITFTPNRVNLTVGGTVTFAFGTLEHNVFFDNAPAGAPTNITAPSANKSTTLTFATKGTYVYNCHLHPGMTGTVV